MHRARLHEMLDIKFGKKERGIFALSGIVFSILLSSLIMPLGSQQQIVLAVTISALFLWLSEFIPLHATALVIPVLLVVFGGFSPAETMASFFDPIIALVLGGFAIALSLRKYRVDEYIGQKLMHRGSKPHLVLLGLMSITAVLSMWMANSAAAAIMLPIGIAILNENRLKRLKSNFAKSVVLGIGFAATIGGIGTLVGSTPNVLTAKFLGQHGIAFGFLDWLVYGLPIMISLLVLAWVCLSVMFRPEIMRVDIKRVESRLDRKQKEVIFIFMLTVILWMTTGLHGIDLGIVSIVPIILLYVFGLLTAEDFHKIDWPALILIGGGIALGYAVNASGLDAAMAGYLGILISDQAALVVSFIVISFGVLFTAFMSNTAAASVTIPFMIPVASLAGFDPRTLAVLAGVGVSLDFIMPSATPPTTMAYFSGYIRLRDLLKAGIAVSILGILVAGMFSVLIWK